MAIDGWQRENHAEKGSYTRQQSTTIVSVKAFGQMTYSGK
jgi:hypothetical protein